VHSSDFMSANHKSLRASNHALRTNC